MKSVLYSVASGFLAAVGSLCGKLAMTIEAPMNFCESLLTLFLNHPQSGIHSVCYDWMTIVRVVFFVLMMAINTLMLTVFMQALDLSRTTLEATVINTAANFFFTAILGQVFFDEQLTIMWWLGTVMIVFGLVLITEGNQRLAKHAAAKRSKRS